MKEVPGQFRTAKFLCLVWWVRLISPFIRPEVSVVRAGCRGFFYRVREQNRQLPSVPGAGPGVMQMIFAVRAS